MLGKYDLEYGIVWYDNNNVPLGAFRLAFQQRMKWKPGGQSSDHPLSQPLHQLLVNFEIKGGASLSLQVYMTHAFTIQIPHLQVFFHQPMTRVSFVSWFFWQITPFPPTSSQMTVTGARMIIADGMAEPEQPLEHEQRNVILSYIVKFWPVFCY